MSLPSIMTPDGRRAVSFLAILGGCVVFTLFAAVAVWLVSGNALYTLILGLAAHLQLLIGMSAFGFVLGRRMSVEATKDGAKFSDSPEQPTITASAKLEVTQEPTGG